MAKKKTETVEETQEKKVDAELDQEAEATVEETAETAETVETEDAAAEETEEEATSDNAVIEELNDRIKRQMAEFDNFRKRSEKEKSQMFDAGSKNVIEKILPVVDNFERGLAGAVEGDAFADGMKMIYKQLMTSLEAIGVTEIEAVGQEFNPEFHNAVMHVEDENAGENEIVEELQKGYMFHDSVVRHSMVKVAN
ncbi:MAG: nucleotide exchange factor GrpE [Lachnospiraceae bacterium]|nr:nucleotide exchange factor GrpE [Lachnospiraceae bacterium]